MKMKKNYVTPLVKVVNVDVELGFAQSPIIKPESVIDEVGLDDYEDDGWV